MARLAPIKGAAVPLFDRLVDETPSVAAEPVPRDTYDLDGLVSSVQREIERLLSTRVSEPLLELRGRERSVIDYGIADLGTHFTNSVLDLKGMSRQVARTIAAYEPRLTEVSVTLEKDAAVVGGIVADVAGKVRYENRLESIAFPVSFTIEHPTG